MVGRKSLLGPILFLVVLLIALVFIHFSGKKGKESYKYMQLQGIAENIVYHIDGERGCFVYINGEWYNIVNLTAQSYLSAGDSISKSSGEQCFLIYKYQSKKEICNSIIHKVSSSNILNKLIQEEE